MLTEMLLKIRDFGSVEGKGKVAYPMRKLNYNIINHVI